MAIFHFSAQVIGRSAGRSSVAASAYRAGVALLDARTGLRHDYTKKAGCDGAEIIAPADAPAWATNRQKLFDEVEKTEARIDAQLCREINAALPVELTPGQNRELVRAFVRTQFTSAGMVADVAYHHLESQNPHAHVLLTLRHIDGENFGKKNRDWNRPELLRQWREQWAEAVNEKLAEYGHSAKIDSRTLIDQREELKPSETAKADELARLPTIHHGGKSEAKKHNAAIAATNAETAAALARARAEGRLQPAPTGQREQAQEDQRRERQQVEKREARERVAQCEERAREAVSVRGLLVEELQAMEQAAGQCAAKKTAAHKAWTRRQKRAVAALEAVEKWKRKHAIRAAIGGRFARPLARLRSTATASRLARDGAIARHDKSAALGEELAQGMQSKREAIRRAEREAEDSRRAAEEARVSCARLKEARGMEIRSTRPGEAEAGPQQGPQGPQTPQQGPQGPQTPQQGPQGPQTPQQGPQGPQHARGRRFGR